MSAAGYRLAPVGALLVLLCATPITVAHLDAARVSVSQLFLDADVVIIARIDAVAERRFILEDKPTVNDVVSATVLSQYKGRDLDTVEFFQDAHGHAHYAPGDTAVVFLTELTGAHRLKQRGLAAGVGFVSDQVRNTEHRVQSTELPDYDWILGAYADLAGNTSYTVEQRASRVKAILLRLLGSNAPDLVESGLLDWENAGSGIELAQDEVSRLLALTRDAARPVDLRLALLRAMSRKGLADDSAWIYLLQNESPENMLSVMRATEGHERKAFLPYIARGLTNPSDSLAEAAARALGHPTYAGAESALATLLEKPSQRLNYAAVHALVGIHSDEAKKILLDAEANHPNPKVRRMISARLSALSMQRVISEYPPRAGLQVDHVGPDQNAAVNHQVVTGNKRGLVGA